MDDLVKCLRQPTANRQDTWRSADDKRVHPWVACLHIAECLKQEPVVGRLIIPCNAVHVHVNPNWTSRDRARLVCKQLGTVGMGALVVAPVPTPVMCVVSETGYVVVLVNPCIGRCTAAS